MLLAIVVLGGRRDRLSSSSWSASQRRLLVQYPKRQVGNRMFGGESSFLPLKINISGVIPPIFASSLLLLPATALGFLPTGQPADAGLQWLPGVVGQLQHGKPLFMVLYGAADHLLLASSTPRWCSIRRTRRRTCASTAASCPASGPASARPNTSTMC